MLRLLKEEQAKQLKTAGVDRYNHNLNTSERHHDYIPTSHINPTKENRISGGHEVNLGSLQPLGLYAANSIFIGDYLTTEGPEENKDYLMLQDLGFEIKLLEKQASLC